MEDMKPHILVITFEGLLSPVFQNQFVPLLSALSGQYHFTVLLVEKQCTANRRLIAYEAERLERKGIKVISLPLLRFPCKLTLLMNVGIVSLCAFVMVLVKGIDIVHIRRYDAIAAALLLKAIYRTPILFDPRGLFIEEKIKAGKWRKAGLRSRLSQLLERKIMQASDAVISFSEPHSDFLKDVYQQAVWSKVTVIPNCVDLKKFKFVHTHTKPRGNRKTITMIYIGGASYWHMIDEMIFFFKHLKQKVPCFFVYLTYENRNAVEEIFIKSGLKRDDYLIKSAPPERVVEYLSLAHFGIALIEPSLAKKVCAPIKFVEYLASGLPVVINQGIGDTETIINRYRVGVLYDHENVERNVTELLDLLADREVSRRCRSVVEQRYALSLAVDRLSRIYARIQGSH